MAKRRRRADNGSITVENFNLRARLRWNYEGRQYCLALGMDYTKQAVAVGEAIAAKIKLDILNGEFDSSLSKYKELLPHSKPVKPQSAVEDNNTLAGVFERFITFKSKQLYHRSINQYQTLLNHLDKSWFGGVSITKLDIPTANKIVEYLAQDITPATLRARIGKLRACLSWAGVVDSKNPFKKLDIRTQPRKPPKPFTQQEIKAILDVFDARYPHYYNYVYFRFCVGARTGEINALSWSDVDWENNTITISKSLSAKREIKPTKTGCNRTIVLTDDLLTLLKSMWKRGKFSPTDFIFTTPAKLAIIDHKFARDYWRPALAIAKIPYRRPYNSRHSFVSHALSIGIPPTDVSAMTGHHPVTMLQFYYGHVKSTQLPKLY
jgi:integrase